MVHIRYGHRSKTVLFPTNVRINPTNWSNDPDQPIKRSEVGYLKKNKTILVMKQKVNDIATELTEKSVDPTIHKVKEEYEKKIQINDHRDTPFFELFDSFVENSINRVSKPTINAYKALRLRLREFSQRRKLILTIESLNLKFYDDFVAFLFSLELLNNTVGKHIKNLKVFLHYLENRGYKIHGDVRKFKTIKNRIPIIYLTQDELKKLNKYDFSKTKRLEQVRDFFVLACTTGLRISDLKRVTLEHVQGGAIKIKAKKTGKDIFVPLRTESFNILQKYQVNLPNVSDQKYNEYIKECCRIAGLDSIVEKVIFKSSNKIYSKEPKWGLISSHVAVKTFITHCGQNGVSPKVVAEITGKTVKIILDHYYGTDESTIIREMRAAFGPPDLRLSNEAKPIHSNFS